MEVVGKFYVNGILFRLNSLDVGISRSDFTDICAYTLIIPTNKSESSE